MLKPMSHREESVSVLDVRSVSKSFGAIRALSDVSFTVGAGEVIGLMGCQFSPRRIPAVFGFSDAGIAGLLPCRHQDPLKDRRWAC